MDDGVEEKFNKCGQRDLQGAHLDCQILEVSFEAFQIYIFYLI
jgi:hypothetical protein